MSRIKNWQIGAILMCIAMVMVAGYWLGHESCPDILVNSEPQVVKAWISNFTDSTFPCAYNIHIVDSDDDVMSIRLYTSSNINTTWILEQEVYGKSGTYTLYPVVSYDDRIDNIKIEICDNVNIVTYSFIE